MDIQLISAFVFFLLLGLFLWFRRDKLQIQKILFPILYMCLYRTKLGLNFMDNFSKRFSKLLRITAYVSVFIGFLGMAVIVWSLFDSFIKMIILPAAPAGVGIVQPFVPNIPGTVYVPFFYFLISIFFIAIVHEMSHGIFARLYGIPIKSSGFAFLNIILPVIPAAFVEPDEKKLAKAKKFEQFAVFSAGPFANVVLGFLTLGVILLIFSPMANHIFVYDGVTVSKLTLDNTTKYPAELAGISAGEKIVMVNDVPIDTVENFTKILSDKKAGEVVKVKTNVSSYDVSLAKNPDNESRGYLGVYVEQSQLLRPEVKDRFGGWVKPVYVWFFRLFVWMFILNLGIGLFNLLPAGPLDGGRMMKVVLENYFDEKKALKILSIISLIFLVLVLAVILLSIFK